MLKNEYIKQTEIEVVTIDKLVPDDHLLRAVDQKFDFSFVRRRMEPLYCKDNGRPAIDPVMLFKMLFIGYVFGIRSERQLMKEIEVNVAYRWFLNMNLTEPVPHHSTISQNRIRRFDGSDVFRQMFEDIVLFAHEKGLIEGKILYTDSTHLKANANNKKFSKKIVAQNAKSYLDALDQAVEEDRENHGKKPLPPNEHDEDQELKEIKVSKTDPESGYMSRENKPKGFYYLDHRTTDNKHNLITDVYVTPANINDSLVYPDRLDYQLNRFSFPVEAVGLDAGYHTPHICKQLTDKNIFGVISYRKPGGPKGLLRKRQFSYDPDRDVYVCSQGKILKYRTTNRSGYRDYVSDPQQCAVCPILQQCNRNKKNQKIISRHVWEDSIERIKENRTTERGEYIKRRRSETVERSFADAKQLHAYRYARFRGLKRVESQSLMTAIAQNIKKMVKIMIKPGQDSNDKGKTRGESVYFRFLNLILSFFRSFMTTSANIQDFLPKLPCVFSITTNLQHSFYKKGWFVNSLSPVGTTF